MADIKSKDERSRNMAAIKSKNTKPEVFFRKKLFSQGYRYTLHPAEIPGHPDIYLKKYNTAIFIHGCFWHRHINCKYSYMPKSRQGFWLEKFDKNIKRNEAVITELKENGIKCLIIWECTIKKMKADSVFALDVLSDVTNFLNVADKSFMEL